VAEAVDITERTGLGIATVMARKDADIAAIGEAASFAPPAAPGRTGDAELAWIATGPDVWLAVAEAPPEDWPNSLERRLDGLCAVSDQSGSYTMFRLTGPRARELLQRGLAIDLHPALFGPGAAATTTIAHIGVIVWRPDQTDTFDVAVFRSYAGSFRHWLDVTLSALDPPSS
jgi:heterotetrameric sarcosine oxidase gamma subunit